MQLAKITRFIFCAGLLAVFVPQVQADELSQMISPLSHPTNFEDPRIISELRPIYAYHEIDNDFVTAGGDVQLYALQARFALSDDLAFIATKDGYIDFNPDANVPKDEGFADIALGFKYALHQDRELGEILTAGLRYEIPLGDEDVFQGEGDGEINPFLSGAIALGNFNVMAGTGFRLRLDQDDSSFYDFDVQVNYEVGNFYPLVEFGLVHVLSAGNRLPIKAEGQDLFNFGSSQSDGETIVTTTVGGRYRITEDIDIGAGYQFPLTSGVGSSIIDYRVYADMIFRFDI